MSEVPGRIGAEGESGHFPASKAEGPDPADSQAGSAAADQWSSSVRGLVEGHADGALLPAGKVIAELLGTHPHYLDEGIGAEDIASVGPMRTAAEHAAVARERWDPGISPVLTTRRVIIALAMDAGVGWPLLQAGIIASLVRPWRPKGRAGLELDQLVWDLLSNAGRELADEQPLLAAALGAPAEWSVQAPAAATAVVWAPSGDRLAFLAGDVVYEVARGETARQVGVPPGGVVSLGWGTGGVVALCLRDGAAQVVRVADGSPLTGWTSVQAGALSGDGTSAWLVIGNNLVRADAGSSAPGGTLGPPATPMAVDRRGSHALVQRGDKGLLLVEGLEGPLPDPTGLWAADWPSGPAQLVASGPVPSQPCALVTLGGRRAVASAESGGGVSVGHQPFPPVAWIATGRTPPAALAADPAGQALAVASGDQIGIWPLHAARPSAGAVPGYDSDRVSLDDDRPVQDFLDADRDARALAALIASLYLKPPIAIGLFGAWGAGKSFALRRIRHMLTAITKSEHAEGYLNEVRVVRFSAWQYAEVNLWASLVDEVLSEIGTVKPPEPSTQVRHAYKVAEKAENQAEAKARDVATAENERRRLTRGRRIAWAAAAGAGILAAGVVAVTVLGAPARLAAGYGAVVGLLTLASAAAAQIKRVAAQGRSVSEAAKDIGGAGTWVLERVGSRAVEKARQKELASRHDYELARQEADRLRQEADRVRELSTSQNLGAVLQRMSALTEYRDQLSLVARTRDRFEEIDSAVAAARERRAASAQQGPAQGTYEPAQDEPEFERVVVMIDDLDRCAPEKVVTVLEAVHLLFDFEMFVVVVAVDTRWLDQSLRIRYRQLLGKTGAPPSDYLEKIIQIPMHLMALDEDMVRRMIGGLTGVRDTDVNPPAPPDRPGPVGPDAGAQATPALQRTAVKLRPARDPLPGEVMRFTRDETAKMSAVAPLIGTTPRTVKRYVNTYRLIKARAQDPAAFDEPTDAIAPDEIVAFLLAVVTGQPALAGMLLPALAASPPGATLNTVLAGMNPGGGTSPLAASWARVSAWLTAHPRHAEAPATRFGEWAREVSRFSFTPSQLAGTR